MVTTPGRPGRSYSVRYFSYRKLGTKPSRLKIAALVDASPTVVSSSSRDLCLPGVAGPLKVRIACPPTSRNRRRLPRCLKIPSGVS